MIDATDRRPCLQGYTLENRGEVLYVWPFGTARGLVVVERDGVPVSVTETLATAVPLRENNVTFLAEMWTNLFRFWRRA